MPCLGLESEPIPLWWTSDFINSSPPGTDPKDEKWIVGEFNCSCVGISKCLPACVTPEADKASYSDIPKKDMTEVKKIGSLLGRKAIGILSKGAAQERQDKQMEALKQILKSVNAEGNSSLVEKLMNWKRS
mmetsp:Transcript_58278/g.138694  ORF Transcript_58278/g.138694 Transcript_58278/m.138694 type:complete len:131 (+) Transcript_58278:3-395(+)